ncbi:LOW QUALITY PROTEIN: RarD protein [Geomicrobium sp. JCM 19055]|nr:LOW QUALITY PROTEIN: RarD protein [Geomicrobium sp. JCM 19055]
MGNQQQVVLGVIGSLLAYFIWGLLPLYWKLTEEVGALETLAHRVVWALLFMLILLIITRQLQATTKEIRLIFKKRKTAIAITAAAVFISINWFVFIFAVNSDRVIEASLGYYINPLMNVLLATVFLKEKLSRNEIIAVAFAFVGVVIMTVYYGYFPWAAFVLALSFCIYGLIKKLVPIGVLTGLTIEHLLVAPFALIYLFYVYTFGESTASYTQSPTLTLILLGSGIATALPLLLFAYGAKRITFSVIGILQYVAPTLMLIIGVFIFQEPFSSVQFMSFVMIWLGLLIFTTSRMQSTLRLRKQHAESL